MGRQYQYYCGECFDKWEKKFLLDLEKYRTQASTVDDHMIDAMQMAIESLRR